MTWSWTIFKFVATTGLGITSNNPVGWVTGGAISQGANFYSNKTLNSSEESLSSKTNALRLIEFSDEYQINLAFGGIGKGIGAVANKVAGNMAKETARLGKEAGREIAKKGFKTAFARTLISQGQHISKIEKIIRVIPHLHGARESLVGIKDLIGELANVKNEQEFLTKAEAITIAQELLMGRIEENITEWKELLNQTRENLLALSKSNAEMYSKNKENKIQHQVINQKVNRLLKRVKRNQRNLHFQNQCYPKSRMEENNRGIRGQIN